jgi:hypothetical protein
MQHEIATLKPNQVVRVQLIVNMRIKPRTSHVTMDSRHEKWKRTEHLTLWLD